MQGPIPRKLAWSWPCVLLGFESAEDRSEVLEEEKDLLTGW